MRLLRICPVALMLVVLGQSVAVAQTVDERQRMPLAPRATASLLLDVFVKGIAGNSPVLLRRALADTVLVNDVALPRQAAVAVLGSALGLSASKDRALPTGAQFDILFGSPDTAEAVLVEPRRTPDSLTTSTVVPFSDQRTETSMTLQIVISNGRARICKVTIPTQEPSNAMR